MPTPNSRRSRRLALAAVLAAWPAVASAQQASPPPRAPRPWTITPYVGVSRHSPVGHYWGLTPDRHHVLVGIHATFPLVQGRRWMLAYSPEAIPLIVVSNNPEYAQVANLGTGETETIETARSTVAGAGIAPIALELQLDVSRRLGVYGGGTMGGLWFSRNVPVADARAFNFTFDFGGGLRLRLNGRTALRMGYKFHHFSNARTAPSNPGVDAEMFLVGLETALGTAAAPTR